jgi:hypothetical protein
MHAISRPLICAMTGLIMAAGWTAILAPETRDMSGTGEGSSAIADAVIAGALLMPSAWAISKTASSYFSGPARATALVVPDRPV